MLNIVFINTLKRSQFIASYYYYYRNLNRGLIKYTVCNSNI